MELISQWEEASGSGIFHQKYAQKVNDVRVFGGEFIVTVGEHGGVLSAHGLPMKVTKDEVKNMNWRHLTERFTDDELLHSIEDYVAGRYYVRKTVSKVFQPTEVVWHMSQMSVARQGKLDLVYYVNGAFMNPFMAFDAFVDVESGRVLHFIDKSGQLQEQRRLEEYKSPFSYPIDGEIYVYDESTQDLVFTTTVENYTYPTEDWEMNLLVDTTLYTKYLFYSLSNGQYLTWNMTNGPLNIEVNLTIANAYFDGVWGIHFGTGYITDDVVPHEWTHGYTQTACNLIYEMESGAMNEAFSDIYGETVDILNYDTPDPDKLRTQWPQSCHRTLNNPNGIPPGEDWGTRWSMGENVTNDYPNNDGSIRDMYKPECFFQPSTAVADYYHCTTYYDGGGVHKNSGVLNRLYAVLVDGGQYADIDDVTSPTHVIAALGWVKATNLFWRTHQRLTPTSQYLDLATTMSTTCQDNIGKVLYHPNVFNSSIIPSNEVLTAEDCDVVDLALTQSGMGLDEWFCPNLECEEGYNCVWVNCEDSNVELFYEDYEYYMGENKSTGEGVLPPYCETEHTDYVRVFSQDDWEGDLEISCIQFGYFMMGQTNVSVSAYVDKTGGVPDKASLELIYQFETHSINAYGNMQVQTESTERPVPVTFSNKDETLVIILSAPAMSEGYLYGGGQVNAAAVGTIGQTYIGGGCDTEYHNFYDLCTQNNLTQYANNQWYVRVHATSTTTPDGDEGDSDDGLSGGAIAGIVIGVIAGVAVVGVLIYFIVVKMRGSQLDKPLLN